MPLENEIPAKKNRRKPAPRSRRRDANDPMEILARIALEEQADKTNERLRKEKSRQHAIEQMHRSEKDELSKRQRFQKVCDHLQGNHRIGVIPRHRQCALHKDYLSDASVRLYCSKCRFEWLPGDKGDFIYRRDGQGMLVKLLNPTGKSWTEINHFLYSFENSADLTSRAFRLDRVEPENVESEEARYLAQQAKIGAERPRA